MILFSLKSIALTVLCSFTILPGTFSAVAQEQTFQEANRLLQQEKLDEARALFEDLYSENPDGGIFFDRLMEVLERLRDYERAIEVAETRINERGASPQVSLRIAELYHASGDSTEAAERWNRLAEEHSSNIQTLYNIGNSLMQRSEYRHAIEHYNLARERLNNPGLFAPEIANARLHSGDIRGAMREYADLLAENPNQLFSIQQRLVRIQDNDVMRAAALEVEDRFASMAADHPSYSSVSQLLIWLLMETEQHRRAMVAARRFESSTENIHFSLYSLANQLLSIEEYELAAEAYDYYIESAPPPFNHQAMEEKASVYIHWAAWLDEHLLESVQRRVELLEEAYELNNTLLEMDSEYRYRDRIFVRQAELSLDSFYDRDRAVEWAEQLNTYLSQTNASNRANLYYLQGRIHLYDRSWTEARHDLTRANREADRSDLTEKARYFLILSDFFAGEYEFAEIQSGSLERRNTSYYANDALKLRMWIQNGRRDPENSDFLAPFSRLIEHLYHGEIQDAVHLIPELSSEGNPLYGEALSMIAARSDITTYPGLYPWIDRYNRNYLWSPFREKLLWEQSLMAEAILYAGGIEMIAESSTRLDSTIEEHDRWPQSRADAAELFEMLLEEFPQGFYSRLAREKLLNLESIPS